MSTFGIQGQPLEITVVGCNKLKNTEWITRQDPYVCIEYGSSKFRTRTCKDGGKNPIFQEKFVLSLIEGLREFSVNVWNSNTLTYDDFIGSGKIQLQRVLSTGYDDSAWALQDKRGRSQLPVISHQFHHIRLRQVHKSLSTQHLQSLRIRQQISLLRLFLCHTLLIQQYIPHVLLLLRHTLLVQQYIPHPCIINYLHILQLIHPIHLLQCILRHPTTHTTILQVYIHHLLIILGNTKTKSFAPYPLQRASTSLSVFEFLF